MRRKVGRPRSTRMGRRYPYLVRLGQRVRELRQQAGLSQTELGRGRRSAALISRIESGQVAPDLGTLQEIAGTLHLPLRRMFPEGLP